MVQRRRQARTSAFESIINNDILETVAGFVDCKDLVNLSLTSKQLSSSVKEVAIRLINSSNARYGGEDEDLPALQELNYLRAPIEFTDLLGNRIGYVGGDKACVYSSNPNRLHTPYYIDMIFEDGGDMDWEGNEQTAICSNYVMRSGKHYAKFTIATTTKLFDSIVIFRYVYCRIGIMRPISSMWKEDAEWTEFGPLHTPWFNDDFLDQRTDAWGENKHCVLYYDFEGTCEWSNWATDPRDKRKDRWDGMSGFDIYDGELGLLLDLDEGTLTVYKDGTRLGVMMDGLSGEYTWVAEITAQANGRPHEQNVRIERAPVPTSLDDDSSSSETEEEDENSSSRSSSSEEEDESDSEAESKESSTLESAGSDETGDNSSGSEIIELDIDMLTANRASSSSSEYDTDD